MPRLELSEQGALVGRVSDIQESANRGPHFPAAQAPTKSARHVGRVQRGDGPGRGGDIWGASAPSQRQGVPRQSPLSALVIRKMSIWY